MGQTAKPAPEPGTEAYFEMKIADYKKVSLRSDIGFLSEKERNMLPLLFEAAEIIDGLFWLQSVGPKEVFLEKARLEGERAFGLINYGPWDRLDGNNPFMAGFGKKPDGANFYPPNFTREDFEKVQNGDKNSPYTLLQLDPRGQVVVVPYSQAYREPLLRASELMKQASALSPDPVFARYLAERADALLSDDYFISDMTWMDLKKNNIDFVIGPIENYEDQLMGLKTSYEAYILIKDRKWTDLLERFVKLLPELQDKLPVSAEYKSETPASGSDLGVYDAVFYAGDCNAGSKTIAINLPNDERVQLEKGSRKLQLKNAMQAKFESILVPISDQLVVPAQRKHINFDAFFQNTMFHEVAHGMGIKNTINGKGPVRQALRDQYSWIEEGKADIMGLFMAAELLEMKEMLGNPMDNMVTFMAGIFRSIRFGASSAHAKANLVRFNYLVESGAIVRNPAGLYSLDPEAMKRSIKKLTSEILVLQGNGDYNGVKEMFEKYSTMPDYLRKDLDYLREAGIPVDVTFEQGPKVLGI